MTLACKMSCVLLLLSILLIYMQIDSIYLTPILKALSESNKIIDTSSPNPINSYGTVQQNFSKPISNTLYNAHGIVTPNTPNTLVAKV